MRATNYLKNSVHIKLIIINNDFKIIRGRGRRAQFVMIVVTIGEKDGAEQKEEATTSSHVILLLFLTMSFLSITCMLVALLHSSTTSMSENFIIYFSCLTKEAMGVQ